MTVMRKTDIEELRRIMFDLAAHIFAEDEATDSELKQLRAVFTAYCLCGDITPGSSEADKILANMYEDGRECMARNDILISYGCDDFDEGGSDTAKNGFENFMYALMLV